MLPHSSQPSDKHFMHVYAQAVAFSVFSQFLSRNIIII